MRLRISEIQIAKHESFIIFQFEAFFGYLRLNLKAENTFRETILLLRIYFFDPVAILYTYSHLHNYDVRNISLRSNK